MRSKLLFSMFLSVMILSLVLAACAGGKAPISSAPGASLSEITGSVQIKNPGQQVFTAAVPGDRIEVGGQVSTGQESTAQLDLSTGTIVRVAPESLFTLQSNETANGSLLTKLLLEAGRVWVVLHGGQVDIETPSGAASVRGSYMSVWVDPETEDVWVTCLEGWCQAENPTSVMDMVAGEGALLYHWDPAGTTPPPPPKLRYLGQAELDEFLANNPEAGEVMNAVIATASALPTLVPTAESTPVSDCFELGLPENGATVSETGDIQFDWNDQPGAFKYILHVIKPNGAEKTFLIWHSSVQISAADLPFGGTYQWEVVAYDSNIQPLCTAGPWTFTKAEAPAPTQAGDCFMLSSPAEAAELPGTGVLNFNWTEQPGRYKYIITITKPNGAEISKILYTNTYQIGPEALGLGGTYSWSVTAYNSKIQPICSAGPQTFSLPAGIEPPTPESGSCVSLLTPASGTDFPDPAAVTFTWTAYPGAYKYIIYFKPPSTPASSFLAWEPSHLRYVESFTEAGTYEWWVVVKDHNINDICTSEVFTFTKPNTAGLVVAPKPGEGGGGSGGGSFWGQNGPTGTVNCSSLYFGVSTDASGMIKVVYSFDADVNGNADPHIVIGNGPGSGSASVGDFSGMPGTTVYWRFAVYNGNYINDGNVYSFTCQP